LVMLLVVGWWTKRQYFDKPTLITVVGEGRIKVQPEMVRFTITVLNNASSSTQAIVDNNHLVQKLISVLRSSGVDNNDISLAYVRVVSSQNQYQASNNVEATLKNLAKLDNLIIELYANGAKSITNIIFTTQNSKDLEQAIALAIKDAQDRAKELAKATKKMLGRQVSITTVEMGEASALTGEASQADLAGVTSSSPSQIEIARQVSIVFELK